MCRVCVEGMHVCVCVCVLSKVLCSVCCSLLVIFLHYNNPRRPFKRSIFFSFIFALASSPFSPLPYLSFPSLFFPARLFFSNLCSPRLSAARSFPASLLSPFSSGFFDTMHRLIFPRESGFSPTQFFNVIFEAFYMSHFVEPLRLFPEPYRLFLQRFSPRPQLDNGTSHHFPLVGHHSHSLTRDDDQFPAAADRSRLSNHPGLYIGRSSLLFTPCAYSFTYFYISVPMFTPGSILLVYFFY